MIELRFATTAPSMNPGNCSSSPSRRRRMMALKQQPMFAEESMTTTSTRSNRLIANRHHRNNHKNQRNSRPTTTKTKMNSFILLTAATASLLLLLLPCPISAEEGLLFQNEFQPAPLSSLRNSLSNTINQEHANNHQQLYSSKQRPHGHPIHRIYRTGAPIRRRMEQLENTMSYYQTGFREIDHLVNYGGRHPFERMRLLNDEREGSDVVNDDGVDNVNEGGVVNYNGEGSTVEDERGLQEAVEEGGDAVDNTASTTTNTDTTSNTDEEPPPTTTTNKKEEEEDPFQPIRIQFDTTALDEQASTFNAPKIAFVKTVILPRMRDFWSAALSVVPVQENLFVSTSELQGRIYCGDSEFSKVPNDHISNGVPNADLILYVSGAPSTRFCGPSTLAVAVACNFDQFDRPTAGAINFCLDQIKLDEYGSASESVIDDNVDVAIHEAAHVLGMSSNSYRFFWDPDTGDVRTPRPFQERDVICVNGKEQTLILPDPNTMKFFIANNGQRYASIVTPKVATVARNQFDCQELNGAQLENQPTGEGSCTGDHWDERLFYSEALSGVISPTTNVLSPLTLALLEDSGWYKANYTKSNNSPWGLGVGCDFISGLCLIGGGDGRDGELPSYSQGFFCNKASSRGCSPALSHKMACTMIDYSLRGGDYMPPETLQYFSKAEIGGPREADFCPVYGSVYSGLDAAELDCRIASNMDSIDVIYSEEYGENSMCFETTGSEGRCYRAQCIYEDFNLKLNVDGSWYTCEEDFQQIEVSTLSGAFGTTVTCPRLSQACPDMFCPVNCAGRGECVFDHEGANDTVARPKCKCFDENDKSASCSETFTLNGKYLRDSGSLTDTIKTNFFEPLIAVFVDHPDTWTTSSWAWAAALFVVFLLMILCICSSFWPEKEKRRPVPKNRRMAAM
eukprot:CAMPEP_0113385332 /NCGR_PEP_ID=MMETSP0013_2-20120614/7408_1 /TAXON_ID=2843 ORGANISM="Skeletonema costatum, Strain 1716" /NCGR_SAMPLE_ID=MMETSP0013_2 /ASSEMBLY_ACC=CAM_ASM_000158 /LENGTH=907 /DNA_ID=CAMNT_0000268077 /DNA_START=81 /DNA_END=2804 /DNA_ORIENTATION=+ /assembly_acc=CAM_ASM_000158